jgi:hypothetical protein
VAGKMSVGMRKRLRGGVTLLKPRRRVCQEVDVARQAIGTVAVVVAAAVRGEVVRHVGRVAGERMGGRDVGRPKIGAGCGA